MQRKPLPPEKILEKFLSTVLKKARNPVLYPLYLFIIFLGLASILFPKETWDFIWRYYWGPVVADARGMPVNGITEGYNPVSTITYGAILVLALYLVYRLFKRLNIAVSFRFIAALIPIIALGAVARVLEDVSMVKEPVSYLFISPLLYLWLSLLALSLILYSDFLEKRSKYEAMVLCMIPYPLILRMLWFFMPYMELRADVLWFILIMATFSVLHIFFVKKRDYERESSLFLYSMYALTVFSYYFAGFLERSGMEHPCEILLILLIAALMTFTFYFLAPFTSSSFWSPALKDKNNLLMIFAHALDSTATWRGISFFSYGEKHVLPSFLMQIPYGAVLFIGLKIVVILFLIYILDFLYKKDMEDSTRNLIKFAIIVLGLAPGLRDMLRLGIGM